MLSMKNQHSTTSPRTLPYIRHGRGLRASCNPRGGGVRGGGLAGVHIIPAGAGVCDIGCTACGTVCTEYEWYDAPCIGCAPAICWLGGAGCMAPSESPCSFNGFPPCLECPAQFAHQSSLQTAVGIRSSSLRETCEAMLPQESSHH